MRIGRQAGRSCGGG